MNVSAKLRHLADKIDKEVQERTSHLLMSDVEISFEEAFKAVRDVIPAGGVSISMRVWDWGDRSEIEFHVFDGKASHMATTLKDALAKLLIAHKPERQPGNPAAAADAHLDKLVLSAKDATSPF